MNWITASHRAISIRLSIFRRDESGVATMFALFMIMMMILVGGIGVDLMHAEMNRVRLQQTLDRAVLAAADLDQTLDPKSVVEDYSDKAGMREQLSDVQVSPPSLNRRSVTAKATARSPTQFMHLMGVEELASPGNSAAEERISNVEVSLVLDISGSMRSNSKLAEMQKAAKTFVNTLLKDGSRDLISISLVPYSEHVNIGADLYGELRSAGRINHRHDYSHCLEIPNVEFASASLNTSIIYDQMQHFQWNYSSSNTVDDTVCPHEGFESIIPVSNSVMDLEAAINAYQPRAGTSIFLGVKWAAALLDPSTRGIVSNLITKNRVSASFSGRPVAHNDSNTLKTIVVMTDGKNSSSGRIKSWAYDSISEYYHWSQHNFWYYLSNYVYSSERSNYYTRKYTASTGDQLLDNVCTAAKDQGIIIWGVGFEVDDHGANVLEKCASSPSHFFRVEGAEISEAFSIIASTVNQLRLTQ